MAESITNKVKHGAEIASKAHGVEIRTVIIDARPQKSASHTKPDQDLRNQLHRGTPTVTPLNRDDTEPVEEKPDEHGKGNVA